ncbi:Cytidylate kinase [bacterium HR23]|nr:Cytidylate kinase [bacterium HR23]
MTSPRIIALDGPVAAGKTAVGKALAHRLGWRFLDTGAMYRAVAWAALQRHIAPDDANALTTLAQSLHIHLANGPDPRWLVDGQDVTHALRTPAVEAIVSQVSAVPGVRQVLVARQRALAQEGNIIVAGRDIGTVVLPRAPLKIFLLASLETRARRRWLELQASPHSPPPTLEEVRRALEERDRRDSTRSTSPLRPAPDAILLDTDPYTIDEVVQRILALAEEKWGALHG